MDRTIVKAGGIEVRLDGGGNGFQGSLETSTQESGVELVHLRIESDEPERPPVFRLSWSHPLVSVHGYWHFGAGYDKGLQVDWGKGVYSMATSGAPVGCLYDLGGRNRLTFALSDALNPVTFHAGVHEESGEASCWVRLFDEPHAPLGVYEATLRLDTRYLPYYETLSDVSAGGQVCLATSRPGCRRRRGCRCTPPGTVSTRTSNLGVSRSSVASRRNWDARRRSWTTAGRPRATSVAMLTPATGSRRPEKVPDMREHVDRVHALEMKFLLWYSVPFVGRHSMAWERFSGMYWRRSNASGLVSSTRASPRCASS